MATVPIGNSFETISQEPLDKKLYFLTLEDMRSNIDVFAYKYYEDMEVQCIENHLKYVWREVLDSDVLEEAVLSSNFTYAESVTANNINYSNRVFNFFIKKEVTEVLQDNLTKVLTIPSLTIESTTSTTSSELRLLKKEAISDYINNLNEPVIILDTENLYIDVLEFIVNIPSVAPIITVEENVTLTLETINNTETITHVSDILIIDEDSPITDITLSIVLSSGNVASASNQDNSFTFTEEGAYTYTILAEDLEGNTDTKTITFTVLPAPLLLSFTTFSNDSNFEINYRLPLNEVAKINYTIEDIAYEKELIGSNSNDIVILNMSSNSSSFSVNVTITKADKFTLLQLEELNITNIDITNCTELVTFSCDTNQIASIDVTNNINLINLDVSENELTSIDISNNLNLTTLNVSRNTLNSLDISNNLLLERLLAVSSTLVSLDVSLNLELIQLSLESNQLTTIDVTNNLKLEKLFIDTNEISNLDVLNNTLLTSLNVNNNNLSNINLNNNILLESLNINANLLTTIDISNNTQLDWLQVAGNNLTILDVSNNPLIGLLYAENNNLSSIDLSNNPELFAIRFINNSNINEINLINQNKLTSVQVENCGLSILNLASNTSLTDLSITNNPNLTCIQIDDLSVTSDTVYQTALDELNADDNRTTNGQYAISCPI